ncbi:MAG: tryptophan synthase subunit alpha [Clostridiales bacterium]|jgi:tryptophan synthase alpha chain|nr:tryptophan synthase subunit alpha [Clostridiales bacterium]
MSRLKDAFNGGKAFVAFVTGGDPSLEKTEEYVVALAEAGADIVEIGIPFSDPIAEGAVIQRANIRALNGGTSLKKLFLTVKSIRNKTPVPLVFLTYANPVYRYGYDAFFAECAAVGIDGIIVPDVPYEEQKELKDIASKYGIDVISLIAPTSKDRILDIARDASGFLYIVSSMGVTGIRGEITTDIGEIVRAVKSVTNIPAAVGFGINTLKQAEEMSKVADGIIVGSALVKIVEDKGADAALALKQYVAEMKAAIRHNDR